MQFLMIGNLQPSSLETANIKQMIQEETAHAKKAYMEGSIRQIWLASCAFCASWISRAIWLSPRQAN
jgi:hypothetical protein